ncbi:GrpB family protein [Streptomyces sp. NPDC051940]|uniref:GrpB family protein n=1 Tax=Streptomyces sp. NPDC051940 TaxID=3155675 RepID=UPI003440C40A
MPFPDEPATAHVVAYRQAWAREFEEIAGVLRGVLGAEAVAVDHVGSTAVPGLAAKDCVDVQVRVRRIDEGAQRRLMAAAGFRWRPEAWNRVERVRGVACPKAVFAPAVGARRCNVHVRQYGGPNARFALLFRDYLRGDAAARAAWGDFKRRLSRAVPDLAAYGQIKAPATELLMTGAESWAERTGWRPPPG